MFLSYTHIPFVEPLLTLRLPVVYTSYNYIPLVYLYCLPFIPFVVSISIFLIHRLFSCVYLSV